MGGEGTLRRAGDDFWVEAAGQVRLPAERHAAARDGQSVVYGIRPEHLSVAGNGHDGVPAQVTVVEPTGADTCVYAQIADAQVCAVFDERYDFAPGATIQLQPRLPVVHLFDATTGDKLN